MMSVYLICVGKLKEKFYLQASEEYLKRLGGYCKMTLLELPEEDSIEKELADTGDGSVEFKNVDFSHAADLTRTP